MNIGVGVELWRCLNEPKGGAVFAGVTADVNVGVVVESGGSWVNGREGYMSQAELRERESCIVRGNREEKSHTSVSQQSYMGRVRVSCL